MRIGIYTTSYPEVTGEGGIGTYTRHLARALAALGHGVHVLTPGDAPATIEDGPVAVHLCRDRYFPIADRIVPGAGANCRVASAMIRLVKRFGLDVVEFPNWGGAGLLYAALRPTPLVVRLYTSSSETNRIDDVEGGGAAAWDVRRERWLSRSADALVTHSDAHRRNMAEELGIDAARIALIPLGIPLHPHHVRSQGRSDELTVVYLGRMENRKGTLDLLRAAPDVLREVPEARFVLIGADRPHCPGGRTHARYIEEELPPEVRGRIRLAGRLPDDEVDRLVQSADLFVAPSLYESFGLIFIEAMRWGTPVIGTRVGGIPEIVEHGQTGLLVAPGSPPELAAAIIALLRDEGRRRRLGEAGRLRVEEEFSVERMALRSIDLYARAIGGRR